MYKYIFWKGAAIISSFIPFMQADLVTWEETAMEEQNQEKIDA